jgi:sugar phosphate isomerase/epimerase
VEAARYAGIGMRPNLYQQARDQGATDGQLRGILDDHDVQVAELEVLGGWAMAETSEPSPGHTRKGFSRWPRRWESYT